MPLKATRLYALLSYSLLITAAGVWCGVGLGVVAPFMIADFGTTRAQVGLLVTIFFSCTGLMSLLGGGASDRMGIRLSLVVMCLLALAPALAIALGLNGALLAVACGVGGLGFAFGNAGTNMLVVQAFAPERRGFALAVKQMGSPLCIAVASFVLPSLSAVAGWRSVGWIATGLAVLCAGLTLRITVPPTAFVQRSSADPRLPAWFYLLPLSQMLGSFGVQAVQVWMVLYLVEELRFQAAAALGWSSLAAMAGMVVVSLISDRWFARARFRLLAVGWAVAGLLLLTLTQAARMGAPATVAVFPVFEFVAVGLFGSFLAQAAEVSPGAVGKTTNLALSGHYAGILTSPFVFGFLVDRSGNYAFAWATAAALMILGAGLCLAGGQKTVKFDFQRSV
jgi:MFS transporter, ACS family, hexuronate transporter